MLQYRWIDDASLVPLPWWRDCANEKDSPFLAPSFIFGLKSSGSVGHGTTWIEHHLLVTDSFGEPVALALAWLRQASDGDFSFDWQWAEIASQSCISYYPKLVASIPATPFARYDILHSANDREQYSSLCRAMVREFRLEQLRLGCPVLQFIHPSESFENHLAEGGLHEIGMQRFTWYNRNFKNFEDYVACFSKNQHRNIRKERQAVINAGLTIKVEELSCLEPEVLRERCAAMGRFYVDHNEQFGPWSAQYLDPSFFLEYGRDPLNGGLLLSAWRSGKSNPIAMSFLVVHKERLFGRYWGALEHVPMLHFEMCYYRPIEYAIESGIRLFDPGLGGMHKLRRGFLAEASNVWYSFLDTRFMRFMEANKSQINGTLHNEIAAMNASIPFK